MIKQLRGGWGFGAERRRWRMKRGGESVAVEKIEQTNSAKIFSGTARRAGLRFAEGGNGGRYPRRRRMTRTLISAGETPLMRLAWPILAGRMRRSFSTASSLNPRWAA